MPLPLGWHAVKGHSWQNKESVSSIQGYLLVNQMKNWKKLQYLALPLGDQVSGSLCADCACLIKWSVLASILCRGETHLCGFKWTMTQSFPCHRQNHSTLILHTCLWKTPMFGLLLSGCVKDLTLGQNKTRSTAFHDIICMLIVHPNHAKESCWLR